MQILIVLPPLKLCCAGSKQSKQMKVVRSLSVLQRRSVINRSFRPNRLRWMQTPYKLILIYLLFDATCHQ